ncbi:epoxyqueuosine reductase QueG [Clostridiales Family XIII bacterium PM5-7]
MESKKELLGLCDGFIAQSEAEHTIKLWEKPVIAIADGTDEAFAELKHAVHPEHLMPEDFVEDAKSVIVIFVPFTKEVVESNTGGEYSSALWDEAYDETNLMLDKLNQYVCQELHSRGFSANGTPSKINPERKAITSFWSHRHVGVIAGLGTLGINNMIITSSGCAGRMTSVVTDAVFAYDEKIKEERCLAKKNGSCMQCMDKCPEAAISCVDGKYTVDKRKCVYQIYEKGKEHHVKEGGGNCGKCSCGVYCS